MTPARLDALIQVDEWMRRDDGAGSQKPSRIEDPRTLAQFA
jgi:hypothetical protein